MENGKKMYVTAEEAAEMLGVSTGYSKTVPAVTRPCYEDSADNGRRFGRQAVKEVADMWMLKFYKAYAKNKRLKRMLAYWGRMK